MAFSVPFRRRHVQSVALTVVVFSVVLGIRPVPIDAQDADGRFRFTATLEIDSEPVGARVFFNGEEIGRTPLTVDAVNPGLYVVRLTREGYRDWEEWIRVGSGRDQGISARLEPAQGTLTVDRSVPGVEIRLGNQWVPAGSHPLPAGNYRIPVRAFGYVNAIVPVVIRDGEESFVSPELVPLALRLIDVRAVLARSRDLITVSVAASAPGAISLRLISPSGEVLYRHPDAVIRSEVTEFTLPVPSPPGSDLRVEITLQSPSAGPDATFTEIHPVLPSAPPAPPISLVGSVTVGSIFTPWPTSNEVRMGGLSVVGGVGSELDVPIIVGGYGSVLPQVLVTGAIVASASPDDSRPRFGGAGSLTAGAFRLVPAIGGGVRLYGGYGVPWERDSVGAEFPLDIGIVPDTVALTLSPGIATVANQSLSLSLYPTVGGAVAVHVRSIGVVVAGRSIAEEGPTGPWGWNGGLEARYTPRGSDLAIGAGAQVDDSAEWWFLLGTGIAF